MKENRFFWSHIYVSTDTERNLEVGWNNRDGDDYTLDEMPEIERMFEKGLNIYKKRTLLILIQRGSFFCSILDFMKSNNKNDRNATI